jgi:hypothetical protein
MASRVAPPSSEQTFYGYEEHGARVCEQELVPLFGGKRDAMTMIQQYAVRCLQTDDRDWWVVVSWVSKEFGPTVRLSAYVENWRASRCPLLCLI